jgi:hypothetical protein
MKATPSGNPETSPFMKQSVSLNKSTQATAWSARFAPTLLVTALTGTWHWWLPLGYPSNQRSFARQDSVDPSGTVFITGTACQVPGSINWQAIVQKGAL